MDVQCLDSADAFLAATEPVRAAYPLQTNVMGSVALGVASGARQYDQCFWWVVRDGGDVVGMGMRTAPYDLTVSPMEPDAARALGVAVAGRDRSARAVFGPAAAVESVLAGARDAGDTRPTVMGRRDVVYEVETLVPPSVDGQWRLATARDASLVVAWLRLFRQEIDDGIMDVPAVVARVTEGAIFLWEVDGMPVSLAGHATPVECAGTTVARVGPVFTPAEQRSHGYAAGVSAAVSERLLATGARVMLHADAANPISNGVYQRLGYVARDEMVHVSYTDH